MRCFSKTWKEIWNSFLCCLTTHTHPSQKQLLWRDKGFTFTTLQNHRKAINSFALSTWADFTKSRPLYKKKYNIFNHFGRRRNSLAKLLGNFLTFISFLCIMKSFMKCKSYLFEWYKTYFLMIVNIAIKCSVLYQQAFSVL